MFTLQWWWVSFLAFPHMHLCTENEQRSRIGGPFAFVLNPVHVLQGSLKARTSVNIQLPVLTSTSLEHTEGDPHREGWQSMNRT